MGSAIRKEEEKKSKLCRVNQMENSESALKFGISARSLFDLQNIKSLQMFYDHELTLAINIRYHSCANSL